MAQLKGNKGEWSEVYVLLRLLADGILYGADENKEVHPEIQFPIIQVYRNEEKIIIVDTW